MAESSKRALWGEENARILKSRYADINIKNRYCVSEPESKKKPSNAEEFIKAWEDNEELEQVLIFMPFTIALQVEALTIASDLVSVQPLELPTGKICYLDYVYNDTKWKRIKQNIKSLISKIVSEKLYKKILILLKSVKWWWHRLRENHGLLREVKRMN